MYACTNRRACYWAKRQEWLKIFNSKDPHSILNQIYSLLWDSAIFHMINKARGLAPKGERGEIQLNGELHSWIDRSFVAGQCLAIRRLTDTGSPRNKSKDRPAAEGEKGVYSLRGLLDDMERHCSLLTRGNLLAGEERDYSPEQLTQLEQDYQRELTASGSEVIEVTAEPLWEGYQEQQRLIDQLIGVDAEHRDRQDTVPLEIFPKLQDRLQACQIFIDHTDKNIAHAATPESRKLIKQEDGELTLAKLGEAQRSICEVAGFLGRYLLTGFPHEFMELPSGYYLKYMDRPLVEEKDFSQLTAVWDNFYQRTKLWPNATVEEVKGWKAEPPPRS